MLEVSQLDCVRGERTLFSGLALRLDAGEALHLQGQNGSGKTSLLRILSGLSLPAAGEVRWSGQEIGKLGEDYRRKICYLGHLNALKDDFTPAENLINSARLADQALNEENAREALTRIGLTERENLPCRYLSQGQKRRVALARLVGEKRALWLLDEPYVALDPTAVSTVADLIDLHLQGGGLVVFTTHQPVTLKTKHLREILLTPSPFSPLSQSVSC